MDLTTRYMGLTLENPLVASALPLSERVDVIRKQDMRHERGALEYFVTCGTDSCVEPLSQLPDIGALAVRGATGARSTALAAQCPAPAVSTLISHSAGLPLRSHAEPATARQATVRKTSRRRSLPPHTPS